MLTLREEESLPTSIPMMTGSHPALRTALFVAGAALIIVTPFLFQELIIFPGDCSFEKVDSDRSGRTYVLKFSSSDSRDFVCRP